MALNRTPPRAMAVQFSIPAMEYQISLAYNKNNPKIPAGAKSVADIDKEGVTLAVMSGTAQDKAISAAAKKATVLRLPGNDETRLAVVSKRADILVGGAPEIPGASMLDKMNHINDADNSLRRFVTFEPHASVAMSVNLLVAPTRPDADAASSSCKPTVPIRCRAATASAS